MAKKAAKKNGSATIGLEAKLWAAADALRNNMDAAEYKHVLVEMLAPYKGRSTTPAAAPAGCS